MDERASRASLFFSDVCLFSPASTFVRKTYHTISDEKKIMAPTRAKMYDYYNNNYPPSDLAEAGVCREN
jgi:hypothetical protein